MGNFDLSPEQLAAAVRSQPPAQMVIAAPINDVQLLAWIAGDLCAGNRGLKPAEAVAAAMEIVAECIVQGQEGAMGHFIDAARHRLALLNGAGSRQ